MKGIKVLKTEEDHKEALHLAEELMSRDPNPDSEEGEQLSLILALIQDYEARFFSQSLPTPLEAIKFRMEQLNLKPADLAPYIGSRSRISEILSGKRKLTLEMIRALEIGLGIPAKILIQKTESAADLKFERWDSRIVQLMETRGYFGKESLKYSSKSELLGSFFSTLGNKLQPVALLRKTSYRSTFLTEKEILLAWQIRVLQKAARINLSKKYKKGVIDLGFIRELIKLSVEKNGPVKAIDRLNSVGVKVVIEPHLPKTYLDGAAILTEIDTPIIGLTLRYDRLDNFWFTLIHELSHVALHLNSEFDLFFDEKLHDKNGIEYNSEEKEKEADRLAEEVILPQAKWEVSPARLIPSSMAANSLASELGVHVAIIAGQIQHKGGRYVYLNKIVNSAKARQYFPDIKWENR